MQFKILFVSDFLDNIKSSFLFTYIKQTYLDFYPTVFENQQKSISINDEQHIIRLWDTSGSEDYHINRQSFYPNTDAVVVMYSVTDKTSFENVTAKWLPDIQLNIPNAPVVVVALDMGN